MMYREYCLTLAGFPRGLVAFGDFLVGAGFGFVALGLFFTGDGLGLPARKRARGGYIQSGKIFC